MPTPVYVQGHPDGTATYYEWHPQGENVPLPELTAEMERIRIERAERDARREPDNVPESLR